MRLLYLLVDETRPTPARVARRLSYGRQAVPEGWSFALEAIDFGPPHYEESAVGHALAVPGILRAVRRAAAAHDAVVIGCFGDPGLRAARAVSPIPIVGPGEASLKLVELTASRFGVLTALPSEKAELELYLGAHGLIGRCVDIEPVDLRPEELLQDEAATGEALARAGERLLERGAEALILGCMSLAFHPFVTELGRTLGAPVVDPLRAAVAALQATATLGVPLGPPVPALERPEELREYLDGLSSAVPHLFSADAGARG